MLASGITTITACALFADLDGLSGGATTAGEAGTADSAVPVVDGGDGPTSPSDAGGGFCRSLTRDAGFCDDFDERPLGFDWEIQATNVEHRLDTSAFTSAPNSMLVKSTSDELTLRQQRRIPAAKHATMALSVRVDSSAPLTLGALFGFTIVRPGAVLGIYWQHDRNLEQWMLVEDFVPESGTRTYESHVPSRWPGEGKWTRVEMTLEKQDSATRLRVKVGGEEALSATTKNVIDLSTDAIHASIGLEYVSPPAPGWVVRYDDVVLDGE